MRDAPHFFSAARRAHAVRCLALALAHAAGAGLLHACDGPQSALAPAGPDAREIATLFWWMTGGACVAWVAVMALSAYAVFHAPGEHDRAKTRLFVLGGGALIPTVVLTALLLYGLPMIPPLLAHSERENGAGARVYVTGEQWWWRVRYELPDGARFELANELRIPVGVRVPLWLDSPDVIHAFWVPSLAGKMDMIPGRVTRAALEADRPGVFLGACAEYCGSAHAQMRFHVVAMEPAAYADWLVAQQQPAAAPGDPIARAGERLFHSLGCGACHAVRGSAARGTVGPDLTHVGSRLAIASAVLGNGVEGFARWLEHTHELKPGVHMPSYGMVDQRDLGAISVYLEGLQ